MGPFFFFVAIMSQSSTEGAYSGGATTSSGLFDSLMYACLLKADLGTCGSEKEASSRLFCKFLRSHFLYSFSAKLFPPFFVAYFVVEPTALHP